MSRRRRALVVDDEPAARRLLISLLAEHDDIEVVGVCRHGPEAVEWLESQSADLLFLDFHMPGLDGFGVLESLASPPRAVVFVTAYDAFAIRAFEAEAWDYLLKPFDSERLGQTLNRVRRRFDRELAEGESKLDADFTRLLDRLAKPSMECIALPKGRGRVSIKLTEVLFIRAESNYARFHLADTSYLTRKSLTALESRLDPTRFVRVHRSAIVNVERIDRLKPLGHGDLELTLDNGDTVTLSRRYREGFEQILELLP